MSEITQQEWQTVIDVLQKVSDNPDLANNQTRFKTLVAKLYRGVRKNKREQNRAASRKHDLSLKETTHRIKQEEINSAITTAETPVQSQAKKQLLRSSKCYICKTNYHELDQHYHMLCPACAKYNHEKRNQRADLNNHVVLITGGRIKIGYAMVLKLLRDGARVIATTRFPHKAVKEISRELDFHKFKDRICFHQLDLKSISATHGFIEYLLKTEEYLDVIINNAAQTIWRPPEFYRTLVEEEQRYELEYDSGTKKLIGQTAQESGQEIVSTMDSLALFFPENKVDSYGQQLDMRETNSWRETLSSVSTMEFIETQIINSFAPFLFNSKLKPLLDRSPNAKKFIVNVSAMEGQFARKSKTERHPHTNMAKAALNMMTRTSASDYAKSNIYMNSVDTGWVSQENPYPIEQKVRGKGFVPPLDLIDGAARIYDPIVTGIKGDPVYGHFLKDYRPYAW